MKDFPEADAREAAERYCEHMSDSYRKEAGHGVELGYLNGYRAAWTKAQGEFEQYKSDHNGDVVSLGEQMSKAREWLLMPGKNEIVNQSETMCKAREVLPDHVTISREELRKAIGISWNACGCTGQLSDMLRSIENQLASHAKGYDDDL